MTGSEGGGWGGKVGGGGGGVGHVYIFLLIYFEEFCDPARAEFCRASRQRRPLPAPAPSAAGGTDSGIQPRRTVCI